MPARVTMIGVVGNSNVDQSMRNLLDSAWIVGNLIAKSGNIVLTGGHHGFEEESVKHYAILGAFGAGKVDRTVGVIGIPPGRISTTLGKATGEVEKGSSSDGICHWVYPHTGLSSGDRNPLTGQTPDILIALHGEKGTPQEVSEAIKAERLVVFLNSWESLRIKLTATPKKGQLHTAKTEEQAVKQALRLVGPGVQLRGGFPSQYKNLSASLCREVQDAVAWLGKRVATV